jgi:SAM-dependent methyltransferase
MLSSAPQYNAFAEIYDRHWSQYSRYIFPVVDELLLTKVPQRSAILDLCCGTGQLVQSLSAKGYQATGLDNSRGMVKLARRNAPGASFIVADARTFRLPETFRGVVSIFDSLNHILSLEELEAVFRNVYAALRPGGLFVFDLSTETGYHNLWPNTYDITEDKFACIFRAKYFPESRRAEFYITIHRWENGWQNHDLIFHEQCFTEEEVYQALEQAGFCRVRLHGYDANVGIIPFAPSAQRAFYVAAKPRPRRAAK